MNADEIEKAKEIVRALRDYASDCDSDSEYCFQCTFACVCDKLDNNAPKIIADLIDSLTAQLTESQRREKAAVEDLKKLATKSITPCHSCAETCLFPASLAPEYQPPAWCREWKWRGPQAEKGEAE